ncbi:7TM diverse intracellular signaling domain-containing protein [Polaromonas sp. YR568]|uniref:sensor domain-containing diguanylate cyclase n=1 Tax=Polaromonas sp. YR568 TaxID=1855301 RepID=UPI0031382DB2
MLWHWLLALALGLFFQTAQARQILDLDELRQPVTMLDWGDALIDETGKKTIADIVGMPLTQFTPTGPWRQYDLPPGAVLWVRFSIPAAPDAERWYLKLTTPGLDSVTLYTRGNDDNWGVQKAGDLMPVADWPLPNIYPVFPLSVSAEDLSVYALRIENRQRFYVPIAFENESGLSTSLQGRSMVYGFYFGLLMMVAGFALFTSLALRDLAHAAFGLWTVMLTVAIASDQGVGGMHLWPQLAQWNDASRYVMPVLSLAPLLVFTAQSISLRARKPWLYAAFWSLALVALGIGASVYAADNPARMLIAASACVVAALLCTAATVWALASGDRFAGWLLVGFAPLLAALTVSMVHAAGWVGASLVTEYAAPLSAGIAIPFVFFVLMLRGQERRDYQRRISQIDRVDPATGLINDLVFMHRMRSMIERSIRLNQQSAVVVMDVANRAEIFDDFGRRNTLKVILRLAGRLTNIMRDVDTVARLGDARFGLLVEGPVPADRITGMATKILARCIAPFPGMPVGLVLKPKIAVIVVPLQAQTPEDAMAQLNRLLMEAAPDYRKNIFTLDLQSVPPSSQ